MNEYEINKLETLKFWFWEHVNPFFIVYKEYIDWYKINKRMPSRESNNLIEKKLAIWIGNQKAKYKNLKLTPF